MKTRNILLLATVATGGVLAAFASGAVPLSFSDSRFVDAVRANTPFMTADDGEDDDGYRRHHRKDDHGHDRDRRHHRDHDDDDDDDDDDHGRSKAAPSFDATPPDNGLILKGTKPKVQVN